MTGKVLGEAIAIIMAKKLRTLGGDLLSSTPDSVGHYPDLKHAMGPAATRALEHMAIGIDNDPLAVADSCVTVFRGIERMGRYALAAHGTERDSPESKQQTHAVEAEIAQEAA